MSKNSINLNELVQKLRKLPNPPPRVFKDKNRFTRKVKHKTKEIE